MFIGHYGVGLAGKAVEPRVSLGTWFLGPPPPNARIVAWMALSQWLVVAWAYWADWHREPVAVSTRGGETR